MWGASRLEIAYPSAKTTTLTCYCLSTVLCSFTPMQNYVPRLARPSFARRQNSIIPSKIIYDSNRLFVISLRPSVARSTNRSNGVAAAAPPDSAPPPLSLGRPTFRCYALSNSRPPPSLSPSVRPSVFPRLDWRDLHSGGKRESEAAKEEPTSMATGGGGGAPGGDQTTAAAAPSRRRRRRRYRRSVACILSARVKN